MPSRVWINLEIPSATWTVPQENNFRFSHHQGKWWPVTKLLCNPWAVQNSWKLTLLTPTPYKILFHSNLPYWMTTNLNCSHLQYQKIAQQRRLCPKKLPVHDCHVGNWRECRRPWAARTHWIIISINNTCRYHNNEIIKMSDNHHEKTQTFVSYPNSNEKLGNWSARNNCIYHQVFGLLCSMTHWFWQKSVRKRILGAHTLIHKKRAFFLLASQPCWVSFITANTKFDSPYQAVCFNACFYGISALQWCSCHSQLYETDMDYLMLMMTERFWSSFIRIFLFSIWLLFVSQVHF